MENQIAYNILGMPVILRISIGRNKDKEPFLVLETSKSKTEYDFEMSSTGNIEIQARSRRYK